MHQNVIKIETILKNRRRSWVGITYPTPLTSVFNSVLGTCKFRHSTLPVMEVVR